MARQRSTPTTYKGQLFRSFLEAEWARYFDDEYHIVNWWYEPRAYQIDAFRTYTPDFEIWVKAQNIPLARCLLEVKPTLYEAEVDERMRALSRLGVRCHYNKPCTFYLVVADDPGCADVFRYEDDCLMEHWDTQGSNPLLAQSILHRVPPY